MHPEFKKGFNWCLGVITGFVFSAILLIFAAMFVLGGNTMYLIVNDWVWK